MTRGQRFPRREARQLHDLLQGRAELEDRAAHFLDFGWIPIGRGRDDRDCEVVASLFIPRGRLQCRPLPVDGAGDSPRLPQPDLVDSGEQLTKFAHFPSLIG
jgi:hypothetical protein